MKKLLALVLALVMTLGLATVGASAAYSDAADVSLNEAVDVMSAVGVFQGSDGKFAPKENLTREQAAKLIAYLDLGENTAEALPALKVFDDVETTRWSAKYIAYCQDAGYIAGDGTGKFNPTGELTGYAFGKMVLCVLGYDAAVEEMVGNNWTIKVAKLMESNDIAKGISSVASATLTREQAAQYCLNALKATMVEYDDKGTTITGNGLTITTGANKAKAQTWTGTEGANYTTGLDSTAGETKQLCEKLYGTDLKLVNNGAYGADDFGRAASTWVYKSDDVYTKAKSPVATFTGATKAADVVTALKGYTVYLAGGGVTAGKYAVTTTAPTNWTAGTTVLQIGAGDSKMLVVNGNSAVVFKSDASDTNVAATIANLTANGRTVEIYASDNEINRIVVINYAAAKITSVTNATKDGNTLTTYTLDDVGSGNTESVKVYTNITNQDAADTAKGDNGTIYAGAAKNDYVTYAELAGGKYVVYPTTTFTGAQSAITTDGKATIDGTSYKVALGVQRDNSTAATNLTSIRTNAYVLSTAFANSKDAANYYVDQFGYLIYTDAIETATNYAIIDRIALVGATGTAGNQSIEAILILPDASTKTVNVAKIAGIKAKDVTSGTASLKDNGSKVTNLTLNTAYGDNASDFAGVIVTYTENSDGTYNIEFPNIAYANTTTAHDSIKAVVDAKVKTTTSLAASGGGTAAKVYTKGTATVEGYNDTSKPVANSNTIFVVETHTSATNQTLKAYTGYANVPSISVTGGDSDSAGTDATADVTYVMKDNKTALIYIDVPYNANATSDVGASSDGTYAYLISSDTNTVGTGSDAYNEFSMIVDGEAKTVKTQTTAVYTEFNTSANEGKLYELNIDSDGYVTAAAEQDTSDWTDDFAKFDTATADDYAEEGVLRVHVSTTVTTFSYSESTTVIVIEDDAVVDGASIETLDTDDTVYVKRAGTSGADALTAKIVYIVKG